MMRSLALALLLAWPGIAPAQMFTDPVQVRQILDLTRPNWIAVREYDGQDLVYYTHLASYRCALAEVRIGINTDTAAVLLPMEPCYRDEIPPNAVRETPYIAFPLGSVPRVAVAITYADGETDAALFGRAGLIRP